MKGRIIVALATFAAVAAALAASSLGFTSTAVVRSSATAFDLHDKSQKLNLQAKDPIHVDIRQVTMTANEVIGWHGHAGPSLLVVKSGSLVVSQPDGDACNVETYEAGAAFVHAEDAHSFRAGSSGADFYIVYLIPEGRFPPRFPPASQPSARERSATFGPRRGARLGVPARGARGPRARTRSRG